MRHKIGIFVLVIALITASQLFAHDTEVVVEVDDPDDQVAVTVEKKQNKEVKDHDTVYIGIVLGSEMSNIFFDTKKEFGTEFADNILPGIYVEVLLGRVSFGSTMFVRFSKTDSLYSEVEYLWTLSWIGTADIRYHFFRDAGFIDPFFEGGLGCAGSVKLPETGEFGEVFDDGRLEALSLFAQIGGGAVIRLERFHIGAKVMWRVYNDIPPATQFSPIDVADFHVAIFAGVGL